MSKFIKLTDMSTIQPITINVDMIQSYEPTSNGYCFITTVSNNGSNHYTVRESYDEVDKIVRFPTCSNKTELVDMFSDIFGGE